ncbi:hypothetical protein Bca101_054354 [Brassica carinata]
MITERKEEITGEDECGCGAEETEERSCFIAAEDEWKGTTLLVGITTKQLSVEKMGKNNKIGSVVRIRQMLKQWQKKAHNIDPVTDVPPGHVAVSVGVNRRRYVVLAKHLNHPIFRRLLEEAEEEYGFSSVGPLAIPCDESLFEEIIGVLARSKSCERDNMATLEYIRRCMHIDYLSESRPLLSAIAEKYVC